jgi:hypothetical protein
MLPDVALLEIFHSYVDENRIDGYSIHWCMRVDMAKRRFRLTTPPESATLLPNRNTSNWVYWVWARRRGQTYTTQRLAHGLVHVGRPNGRWWNGAWRVTDMERLTVCQSTPFPRSSQIESSLMFFVFLRSESGDMSSARVARTIVPREVAVAHEGVDFKNMKVVVLPRRLDTAANFLFPSSLCLVLRPKNAFALLLVSSIRKMLHVCIRVLARVRVSPPSQVVSKLYP